MRIIGYIILVLIILIIISIILTICLRKKYIKWLIKKDKKKKYYYKKLEKLKNSDPKIILQEISKLSLNFFKEKYEIKNQTDHSELIDFFREKNKIIEQEFCKKISEFNYSDETISKKDAYNLIKTFEEILSKSNNNSLSDKNCDC